MAGSLGCGHPVKAVRKYLRDVEAPPVGMDYGHVVVIPSFGEGETVADAVRSVPDGPLGPTLKIVVLNARASSDASKHAANEVSRQALASLEDPTVVVLDHAANGRFLSEGQGVGLARKLGADAALSLIDSGRVASSWICSTDADALLPPDYFERLPEPESLEKESTLPASVRVRPAAALFPYAHIAEPDPQEHRAILLYECFLRYQRLALEAAGSPYAFHTVGSTIAVVARAYAEVRGFPMRSAGEDFYFLNKLAKIGSVHVLEGAPVRLQGRCSDRVPFGTGRAMLAFRREGWGIDEYRVPDPETSRHLRCWLHALRSLDTTDEWSRDRLVDAVRESSRVIASESGSPFGPELEPGQRPGASVSSVGGGRPLGLERLLRVLDDLKAFDEMSRFGDLRLADPDLRRRVHGWFDAFRTMKFLHALRDAAYPDRPFREVLTELGWLAPRARWKTGAEEGAETRELETLLDRLKRKEEACCRSVYAEASGHTRGPHAR